MKVAHVRVASRGDVGEGSELYLVRRPGASGRTRLTSIRLKRSGRGCGACGLPGAGFFPSHTDQGGTVQNLTSL
jgi:hypothetical protein